MITIKTQEEIQIIAEGGKILAKALKQLEKMANPELQLWSWIKLQRLLF